MDLKYYKIVVKIKYIIWVEISFEINKLKNKDVPKCHS